MTAETPVLQTDRTDTGRIIESKMVTDLPLTFNRNFQSLLITVPGSTRPHREHSQFFNSQDSLRFEVNGQAGMASNTLIEGLDDNHKTGLLQVIIPAADALETVSRHDQQLRRRVRPVGRRDHQRHDQVGHQPATRAASSSSATTRRRTPATTSTIRRRRPSSSTPASRSAARSSGTSCSSSAPTSARSTTAATSSAPRCRPR